MASVMELMQLCRLCLVKDEVNIPIFEDQGDIRQIFLKISACLPVKVSREDSLPKKICDGCSYKLELLYEFWNTSANSEKQLLKWLNQVGIDKIPKSDKSGIKVLQPTHSMNSDGVILKQEVLDIGDTHGADDDDLVADDLNESNDAQDYILQQQQLPYEPVTFEFQQEEVGFVEDDGVDNAGPSSTITSELADDPPKRKRRAAAMKALPPHIDSEDEDDVDMMETKIAKTEEQSDESGGEDPEPTTFVGLPSTSTDNEQPGPSGVGKGSAEAPCSIYKRHVKLANSKKLKTFRRSKVLPLNSKVICSVCNKTFKSASSLSQHMSVHNEKVFECEHCDKRFKRNFEVKIHYETYHAQSRKFPCGICGREFHKKQLLKYHFARHTYDYKVKCDKCDKGFYTTLEYKRHYAVKHEGVRFVCTHCQRTFLDENCFKRHIKTHETGYVKIEYKCTDCSKSYNTKGGLNVHMKLHQNVAYVCDICGKSVTSKTSLNQHIMLHTGEKPFVCETCGKCFNKKMLLRIHERIHTKVKPYSCGECGKCFSQRSTLNVHMRYHTGYRPFCCSICQKEFVTKTLLKVHAKKHGPTFIST